MNLNPETFQALLFYGFSGLALLFGVLLLLSRNPVTSAMFLVLAIASIAGLFVLLQAYFLAAVQILVYAGAVMVLFLFVIMLLDLKAEQRRHITAYGLITGLISVGAILGIFLRSLRAWSFGLNSPETFPGGTVALGTRLFTDFLLPFEIVSILLLVAMVGVVLLSRKAVK
jgi:NADH-quinone oxidoreductase subunit J